MTRRSFLVGAAAVLAATGFAFARIHALMWNRDELMWDADLLTWGGV